MLEPAFGHTLILLEDRSVLAVGVVSGDAHLYAERYLPAAREPRPVTGLFTDPYPTEPDHVGTLSEIPPSPFKPWNGQDVVLYDTLTMTETNLGPGWVGGGAVFSPDGTHLVWTAGQPGDLSEIWLLDLKSGEKRLLISGVAIWWLDDHTLYGRPSFGASDNQRLDIHTTEWSTADDIDPNQLPGSGFARAGRWTLERISQSEYPGWTSSYLVTDSTGANLPLEFDATETVLTPDGSLFVATAPTDAHNPLPNGGPHIEAGTTNIFEVDPTTGVATHIARAEASAPSWSFDASEGYVAWMDGFCARSEFASTMIYSRASGELTQLDALLWFKLASGRHLASGVFGGHQLIDIETLEYSVVLPREVSDVAWSPDYRYAAVGFQFGHGAPAASPRLRHHHRPPRSGPA